ncbi:cellulose-binding protein, partial [Micromonospora ureilytica]
MRRRSKIYAGLAAAIVPVTSVLMALGGTPASAAVGGSGPYPADYETSATLANHTIFRPQTLPAERLPIVVWGNGGCSANGLSQGNFLREIASHGFLAIANGAPNGSGSTTSQMLTQSIDWAVAENSRQGSKYYNKIDTSKVAVAGFSCGGLEAYAVSNDPRVTTTGIFSSGLLNDADDYQLRRLTKPIAYFVGGPSDIAYPNAMDDWGKLPAGLPAFMGNLNVGHGGTYDQANGGEFGRVATLYFKWRLKGDTTAGRNFVGADCGLCRSQWSVQQKNLTLDDGTPPTTPP